MKVWHAIGWVAAAAVVIGVTAAYDRAHRQEDLSMFGPMPCNGYPFVPAEVMREVAELFMRDKIPATSILGRTAMQCVGSTPHVLDVCAEVIPSGTSPLVHESTVYGRLRAFDPQPIYETVITDPSLAAEECRKVMPQLRPQAPETPT